MMRCPVAADSIVRGDHRAPRSRPFLRGASSKRRSSPTRPRQGTAVPMSHESDASAQAIPAVPAPSPGEARTRLLLEGPVVTTLLRLAAPNVVVNVVLIAVTATIDAHFVGRLGAGPLAGISLVFPLIMLMQQMANASMGGAITSAIARA